MNMKKTISLVVLFVLAVVLPAVINMGFLMTSLVQMVLYMYWACAWNIMGGYAGLFSLGNGIYIGVGAYTTGILYVSYGVSPWIGIIIGGIIAGLLSLIIGYPTFRIKGLYYSLATFALLAVMKVIFQNTKIMFGIPMGGSDGYKIPRLNVPAEMQFANNLAYYYIALALLVIILFVSYFISKSRTGYYFRAINANDMAASSLGVNVIALKLKAQFITALFTGIGGGVFTMLLRYIDPGSVFGVDMSINIMIMAVTGGSGTLWGPVLGAGLLRVMNQIFVSVLGSRFVGIPTVVFGVMLMLVVCFIPGGILGYAQTLKEKRAVKIHKATLATEAAEGGEE
jgi:branched-chain amino acid transport system permease protein